MGINKIFRFGTWQVYLLLSLAISFPYLFSLSAGEQVRLKQWSEVKEIPLSFEQPNLVMFLHSNCDCSLATLEELKKIHDSHKGSFKVNFLVAVYQQDKGPKEFWSLLEKFPAASVILDEGGKVAARIGAKTSGVTYLIDQDKRVVFQGGLTPSRGHRGETSGQKFISQWIQDQRPVTFYEKVFGCIL